ncbi:DUF3050 domain-containing protein [Paraburkholderia sp. RL18-103-BIB-C]|jgi:hypothetical protein|uniref:DUF3050 domain-containing protein n=1 Tax=unclassified Paraburkholderia TaxID=2615204 RepID=UPI0038BC0DD4
MTFLRFALCHHRVGGHMSYQEINRGLQINDHADLAEARRRLLDHTIYRKVANVESLRSFMGAHVFAVWDFMSLAKRLQRELTCVSLPWMPSKDREGARLINEITLAEESDIGPDRSPIRHLELYVGAMKEVGADTKQFETFCGLILQGLSPTHALSECAVPEHVQAFVLTSLRVALTGSVEEVMAYFLFGREDVILGMFERLQAALGGQTEMAYFRHYLNRHIELDGGEHGPAALNILLRQVGNDRELQEQAIKYAVSAIEARIRLFSGIERSLPLH